MSNLQIFSLILIFVVTVSSFIFLFGQTESEDILQTNITENSSSLIESNEIVIWESIEGKWIPRGNPEECPEFIFDSPVDVEKATSVLYPGQYRGDDYKTHGGFRFDNQTSNEIKVTVPFDGYVKDASRYLVDGEIQYTFNIINSCGLLFRFGHLLELSPEFMELANELPEPREMDSRTFETEHIEVKKGDLIANKVGLEGNVFLDFGVYDLRNENEVSKDISYREKHSQESYNTFYSICWLNNLEDNDKEIVMSLPGADQNSGKESDYC